MAQRHQLERFEASDYYAWLGFNGPSSAGAAEIRRHYRQLALKWHPDKHTEGEAKENANGVFHLINEAHEVLSDASLRPKYDEVWRRVHQRRWRGIAPWAQSINPQRGSSVEPLPPEANAPRRASADDHHQPRFQPRARRPPGGSLRDLRRASMAADEAAEEAREQRQREERDRVNAEAARQEEEQFLRERDAEFQRQLKRELQRSYWQPLLEQEQEREREREQARLAREGAGADGAQGAAPASQGVAGSGGAQRGAAGGPAGPCSGAPPEVSAPWLGRGSAAAAGAGAGGARCDEELGAAGAQQAKAAPKYTMSPLAQYMEAKRQEKLQREKMNC